MPLTSEIEPADRPDFIFVGEHPAIDFANTLASPRGYEEDLFHSWNDLVEWMERAGLAVDAELKLSASHGADAPRTVSELREAWKTVLARLVEGGRVDDDFVKRINRHLAGDPFTESLHREGKNGFHLHRSASHLTGKELALAVLARQIALFLANANFAYLRRCANTTSCTLYFYDTTKNHRRQWCSAAACGNRHKVAAFRRRQATRS